MRSGAAQCIFRMRHRPVGGRRLVVGVMLAVGGALPLLGALLRGG